MERTTKVIAWVVLALLLIGMSTLTLNIRPIKANPGYVMIRVQYADGCPRSNAFVLWRNTTEWRMFGETNGSGIVIRYDYLAPGFYQVSAWYPDLATQFGGNKTLEVNGSGDGSQTIEEDYEITPPAISILSPQNQTYAGRSIPLNFSVLDYSPISWMGYSLDGQSNTTVTGNVTLNVGAGSHNVVVYANDTYGNMGSSDVVCFSSLGGCVVITVQYQDGCPRSGAEVKKTSRTPIIDLGTSNESGLVTSCGVLGPGNYIIKAYYPSGTQFGPNTDLDVDANGDGSATITAPYNEDIPPVIEILSPQNTTYTSTVPLTFTYNDYSNHSWYGYSLDNNSNETITGNTTLTGLSLGSHNVIVYANDTNGNMGASNRVCFTVALHDIAILNITFSKQNPSINETIFIYVTVINKGGFNETFDVNVNCTLLTTDPLIGNQTITLAPSETIILNFTWTPNATGRYEIKATSIIPNDVNPSDNTRIDYVLVSSVGSGVSGGSVPRLY